MYFTHEDYEKIEKWLSQRTISDNKLPIACSLNGDVKVPILQNGINKLARLKDFLEQATTNSPLYVYNVSKESCEPWLSLEDAISHVPLTKRVLGLIITFRDKKNHWFIYQFTGESLCQWDSLQCWENIVWSSIKDIVSYSDEEDITTIRDNNKNILKFKDREYNPDNFIGKGITILRRNVAPTGECCEKEKFTNILVQDMISRYNTIYIVEYDFDLNGGVITIPENCTLYFKGGTINNGTVFLQDTAILGVLNFNGLGNANIRGTFKAGQLMNFTTEDLKEELRWWNGTEWKTILTSDSQLNFDETLVKDFNTLKETVRAFLEDTDIQDATINRWKELEQFLNGITDQETLAGMLENVTAKKVANPLTFHVQDTQDSTVEYDGSSEKSLFFKNLYHIEPVTTLDITFAPSQFADADAGQDVALTPRIVSQNTTYKGTVEIIGHVLNDGSNKVRLIVSVKNDKNLPDKYKNLIKLDTSLVTHNPLSVVKEPLGSYSNAVIGTITPSINEEPLSSGQQNKDTTYNIPIRALRESGDGITITDFLKTDSCTIRVILYAAVKRFTHSTTNTLDPIM